MFMVRPVHFGHHHAVSVTSSSETNSSPTTRSDERSPMTWRPVCSALLLVCAWIAPARGQAASATLSGHVTDTRGAIVAGATVEAVQTATGVRRTATTNSEGAFALTSLPVGTYDVGVSASGFAQKRYAQ